jgi:hypothetical protein
MRMFRKQVTNPIYAMEARDDPFIKPGGTINDSPNKIGVVIGGE